MVIPEAIARGLAEEMHTEVAGLPLDEPTDGWRCPEQQPQEKVAPAEVEREEGVKRESTSSICPPLR